MSENVAAAKMKAGRLKMRKDVWTRTLFSMSQWGVCMGSQVMYYLESDLPLCLIRAWLREAVTGAFSPRVRMSALERGRTCDLHTQNSVNTRIHWIQSAGNASHSFVVTCAGRSCHRNTEETSLCCIIFSDSCGITCCPCGAVFKRVSIGNVSGPQGAVF